MENKLSDSMDCCVAVFVHNSDDKIDTLNNDVGGQVFLFWDTVRKQTICDDRPHPADG